MSRRTAKLKADRLHKANRVVALGWLLTAAGGATVAAASATLDPADADRTTRGIVTAAFGIAQAGLGVVALAGLYRLYHHAERLMQGKKGRRR